MNAPMKTFSLEKNDLYYFGLQTLIHKLQDLKYLLTEGKVYRFAKIIHI